MDPTPTAATTRDGDQATVKLSGYLSGSPESLVAPVVCFVDMNVLVYAQDASEANKQTRARE